MYVFNTAVLLTLFFNCCKDERLNLLPCFKINNLFQKINKPLFTYKKTGKIVKIEQILDNNGSLRQHKHDSTL